MTTQHSTVSIVVPVYNDPEGVRTTIESLLQLSAGTEPDLVIVDNNSTDETSGVIATYEERVQALQENEVQSSYAARNKGVTFTRNEVVALLDSDETVDLDWLETALEAMDEQGVDYVGCNVELTLPEDTLVGRYNARTGFPVEQYLEEEHYAPTCALLVKREVFEDVGPFDARLISGGDREFGERVYEAGYDQGYAEDATVYHPARTSFEALAKKNFRVGRGFCQKQRYYPERYGDPGIPPRPSGPGNSDEEDDELSLATRLAFAFLSVAMLACRGLGYYYEFFFGEERDDIPPPTS